MQHRANLRAEADHYFLFEADRKPVIDYRQDRVVRICTGESRHLVPLKVTYDGESTSLGSNECKRVEAKSVFLEPKDRLDPNFVIHAEVQTM